MKILFVIGSLEIGGAEKQMCLLATRLRSMGCSCAVFALQAGGPLYDPLRMHGIPVYDGGLQRGDLRKSPWKLLPAQWRLLRAVYGLQPDVVHAFLPLVTFMGAAASRLTRVPLTVTSRRGLANHQDRYPLLRAADRLANLLSRRITVNSKAVREDVIHRDHVRPSKLVLIYNGVDRAPFESALDQRLQTRRGLGIGEQEKAVIVVGNLIPYKGHADLIEAAGKVIHHVPDVRFIIVGEDRGIRHDLEKKTDRMGMTEYIKFLGRRDDVPHLLAASDLSVLPSHEEGFSNVILESMAAGLPVVATSAGGNGEGVEDGVTGWLVPPKDPDALAEKIMDLLRDPDRARAWGKRGRKRVGDYFSVDRMVQSHLELYRSARASKIRVQMARLWS